MWDLSAAKSLLISLLALLLSVLYLSRKRPTRPYAPGPRAWPVLGNLLHVRKQSILEDFRRMRTQYGDIFSINFGSLRLIVVNGYDNLKEVFLKRDEFVHRSQEFFNLEGGELCGLVTSSGVVWREQRSFAVSSLRPLHTQKREFEPLIMREVSYFLDDLQNTSGKPVDLKRVVFVNAANVIASITASTRFRENDETLCALDHTCAENVRYIERAALAEVFPVLRYIPGDPFKRKLILRNILRLRACMRALVEEHQASFDPDHVRDMIDVYLKSMITEKKESPTFTEKQLVCTVTDLFLAGTETTLTAIRWAVLYLLHYPRVQCSLQDEIYKEIGQDRPPFLSDRSSLPYMMAFLTEVLRCGNPVCLSLQHSNTEDTSVNGFFVPAGTSLIPNLDSVHMDPTLFPQPEVFKPERFLDNNGCFVNNEHVIPFGIGRRVCVGDNLAKAVIFLFMTSLLQKFSCLPEDKEQLPPLHPVMNLIRRPTEYRVVVQERTFT